MFTVLVELPATVAAVWVAGVLILAMGMDESRVIPLCKGVFRVVLTSEVA